MSSRPIRTGMVLMFAGLVACGEGRGFALGRSERSPYVGTDSMGNEPVSVVAVPLHARPLLIENSAAALSTREAGIFFSINDSGNEPFLFAFDSAGVDRGAWRVGQATNVDWEAAATGPCGGRTASSHPTAAFKDCVYIGDTGDNAEVRLRRTIYRVREPAAHTTGFTGDLTAEALTYSYPDTSHDVEAMFVTPDGSVKLITKRLLHDAGGRPRPALIFSLPASAWGGDTTVVAVLADSLPIIPGSAPLRFITDAALTRDGRHLAVRTYVQVYIFATDGTTGTVRHDVPPSVCNIVALAERQGEGIAWTGSGDKLLLTSEGAGEPMYVVRCPMPAS